MKHLLFFVAATSAALPAISSAQSHADGGTLWLGTDLSYELPLRSSTTLEFGFGLYGLGGGVNIYTTPDKQGLMFSARIGTIGIGYAVNAELNYVGHFSRSFSWRVGAGAEYINFNAGTFDFPIFGQNVPINLAASGFVPMFEVAIGFHF